MDQLVDEVQRWREERGERDPISFLTKLVCTYEDVKPSFCPIKYLVW